MPKVCSGPWAPVCSTFALSWALLVALHILCHRWTAGGVYVYNAVCAILVFYCLAGTTLIREVRMVFRAADRSLEEGRPSGKPHRRKEHRGTLRPGSAHRSPGNTGGELERRGHRPALLAVSVGTARHADLQNGEYAGLHDWLPQRAIQGFRVRRGTPRRHGKLHSGTPHRLADGRSLAAAAQGNANRTHV